MFIPNSISIQGLIASSHRPVLLQVNATTTLNYTASDMVRVWMSDKRYKNQIGDMVRIRVRI